MRITIKRYLTSTDLAKFDALCKKALYRCVQTRIYDSKETLGLLLSGSVCKVFKQTPVAF